MAATRAEIHVPLFAVAEAQRGLVTRHQADEAGLTRAAWRHLTASGDWEAVSRRVIRRRGSPVDERSRALAAVLDMGADAYLSHGSAAALWGVPGFRLEPIHLIVTRVHSTPSALAVVHHPRHLPQPFAAVLDGIPVVRPSLMLLELAPSMHPEQLRRRLDWLWSRRLLSGPSLQRELADVLRRGRPGTAALRHVLDRLPPDYVPPASGLESRFQRIVADHELPVMRRQVDLGDDVRWCGRVDFKAVDLPLVVEVQSDLYHRALSSRADDAERRSRLEAAGLEVVEVDEAQVWHRVAEAVALVRAGAWRARARQASRG